MSKRLKDVFTMGFALFSMFFGAGNLLFPPYLGLGAGTSWFPAFIGFIIADAGLSVLVVTAAAEAEGDMDKLLGRAGHKFAKAVGIACILCIGPLLAIPRTAATTYEMSVLPFLGDSASLITSVITTLVFFAITYVLAIRPSKVLDIIGKVLTPILLLSLLVLIIKGIVSPLGTEIPAPVFEGNLFAKGFTEGYFTMDPLGAAALSTVIVMSIVDKGYTEQAEKVKMTIQAGIIAAVALSVIYGGLCYLGATSYDYFTLESDRAAMLVKIANLLLGNGGQIILSLIVAAACLTTSIGLSSACGAYFEQITNGKWSYGKVVTGVVAFSFVVSNFGVNQIIKFSVPILIVIYPVLITLVLLALFSKKIANDNVFKFAGWLVFIYSLILAIAGQVGATEIQSALNNLPLLGQFGFAWLYPGIIGAIIGNFVPMKKEA